MRLLFSHSLGPVPWSLANADGTPVKTTKSTLLVALEAGVPPVEVLSNAAHAIDAMAMIQSMKAVSGTFADFAKAVFARVLSCGGASGTTTQQKRLDFVCDQYLEHTIKGAESRR